MAIENIKQMTRPLSEEKKVASHDAPEDYLKRAVEQFIIEFPEFEDLPSEELYKEMEKKGYFSDQYAMSDPHPDAERFDMMDILAEKYFGKPYDKLTPKEIELLEENWDELISKRKQQGIMQLAAYPMGYPGRAEEDMERAYDDYQKKHMLGTPGYESPLFDEDGIIQIDPSTVFGLWMES